MVNPIPVKPQRAANPRLQPLEGQNPRAHSQWPVNHLLPSRWKAGVVLFSLHHLLSTVISSKAHKSPKWKSKHYSLKKKKNKEGKGKTVSDFPGLYYSSLSDQNEFISAIASLVFPIFNILSWNTSPFCGANWMVGILLPILLSCSLFLPGWLK